VQKGDSIFFGRINERKKFNAVEKNKQGPLIRDWEKKDSWETHMQKETSVNTGRHRTTKVVSGKRKAPQAPSHERRDGWTKQISKSPATQ